MKLKDRIKKIITKETPDGFWKSDEIHKLNCTYNIIFGGRDNGKSTEIRDKDVKEAWEEDKLLILMFRREKRVAEIIKYFRDCIYRDSDGRRFVHDLTNGQADDIYVKAGDIYFTKEGKKVKSLGYVVFLENELELKSLTFPGAQNMIYEEFISKNGYLIGECEAFDSVISTIFRLKKDFRVDLIGNTISRITPYTREWGLTGLMKQESGSIEVYERDFIDPYTQEVHTIKIACEKTRERPNQHHALSKKGQQAAKGQWEAEEKPHLSREELDKCKEQYRFVVTYAGFYFLLILYRHYKSDDYFLYCERKTTPIKEGMRVIGDITNMSNLYTRTFIPLVERERFVFNLIKEGKMYFCDDITGADFDNAYQSIQLMR